MLRLVCAPLAFLLLLSVLLQALLSDTAILHLQLPALIGGSSHRCITLCTDEQAWITLLCCWLQLLLSILPQPLHAVRQFSCQMGVLHLQPPQMPQIVGSSLEAMLLACLQEMQIVPSIRVESLTEDPEHNDVYSAYNKPGAVLFWLRVSHQVPLACRGCLTCQQLRCGGLVSVPGCHHACLCAPPCLEL